MSNTGLATALIEEDKLEPESEIREAAEDDFDIQDLLLDETD
jgi:hypothetical protein